MSVILHPEVRGTGLDRQLALVSQARKALTEARSIDEVKDIRDKAEAMRLYLKQRDESHEAQNAAAEIKLWAERRAGEILAEMPKQRPGEYQRSQRESVAPKLADMGIDHNESSRWQAIASVPEEEFTRHVEETKAAGRELTTNGIIKVAKERKAEARQERKRADLATKGQVAPASPNLEVVEGDCIPTLATIAPGSARLVFADPPYNLGIDYGYGEGADAYPGEVYLEWCRLWIAAVVRTLSDDGSMWILICDEWADEFGCMLRRAGLHRRAWIKWYESFGVNCANNFNRCSRHLFYTVKDPRRFIFHPEAVSRPSDRQAKYNDPRAVPGGKLWDDVWGVNPPIPRLAGTHAERLPDFPTQLPVNLLLAVVGCASDPGDLVIDPFSGSGTTGVAAARLGRRYLGIEKSSRFADLSRMRLAASKGVSS